MLFSLLPYSRPRLADSSARTPARLILTLALLASVSGGAIAQRGGPPGPDGASADFIEIYHFANDFPGDGGNNSHIASCPGTWNETLAEVTFQFQIHYHADYESVHGDDRVIEIDIEMEEDGGSGTTTLNPNLITRNFDADAVGENTGGVDYIIGPNGWLAYDSDDGDLTDGLLESSPGATLANIGYFQFKWDDSDFPGTQRTGEFYATIRVDDTGDGFLDDFTTFYLGDTFTRKDIPYDSTPAPGTPGSPSPADNAVNVPMNTNLTWTACSGADLYRVFLGTTYPPAEVGTTAALLWDPPADLIVDQQYYWKVVAENANGMTSSADWDFRTCDFNLTDTTKSFGNAGGSHSVQISTGSQCQWTAVPNVGWITITSGSPRTGSGPFGYTVAANAGAARVGVITIMNTMHTVMQSGPLTANPSPTPSAPPSATPNQSPTRTATATPSRTATATPSRTPTATPSRTATPTPSRTPTPTPTIASTSSPTRTPTPSPSATSAGPDPEARVMLGMTEIPDGGGPVMFGPAEPGGMAPTRTFTVHNDGATQSLFTNAPTLPSGYSLTEPLSFQILPGSSDSFTVALSTANEGTFTGLISFQSNDTNESPYDIAVTGTIAVVLSDPEITVQDGMTNIPNGGGPVSFGSVAVGAPSPTKVFTVRNQGATQTLFTSAPSLPVGYLLSEGLAFSIPPGGNDTFTVQLQTGTPGLFAGTVSIPASDPDENPFTFSISGQIQAAASPTGAACCPGDANNSGSFVDANDFIAVQANFGADNGVGGLGDANCSGSFVDANDFIAVQANFGADCGP